jgi:CBS domain-containing protein
LIDAPRPKQAGDTAAGPSRTALRTESVRNIVRHQPPTITSGSPLAEALRIVHEHGGDALLVTDGAAGRLVGIFTEHDVLMRVLGREIDPRRPIDEFMTAGPATLGSDATLVEAMQQMQAGGYRNLPVVDADGRAVGLLRQIDVLEYVAEAFPQEILNLPPRPHQLMEEPEGA